MVGENIQFNFKQKPLSISFDNLELQCFVNALGSLTSVTDALF